jgi:glycosyltransferase involved in cell wall biosynthesis
LEENGIVACLIASLEKTAVKNPPRKAAYQLPLVGICIPAFNAERFLAETLESALGQDYPKLEIIVSDDASTDRTPEIVATYSDHGVRLIRQPRNLGMTRNMNFVIRASQGKYVVKLDADDILEPNYVSTLVPVMETKPKIAFAHCACRLIDINGNFLGYERSIRGSFIKSGLEEWPRYVFGPRAVHILMLRRAAFDAVGGYCEDFLISQDWKLERDLLMVGDVYYCDRLLAQYRCHSQGKDGLGLLRVKDGLQHLEDMEHRWPAQVPGKERLLRKSRRHQAGHLIHHAAFARPEEAREIMTFLPEYGDFPGLLPLVGVIHWGGAGMFRSAYRIKLYLRQMVKKCFYKDSEPPQ